MPLVTHSLTPTNKEGATMANAPTPNLDALRKAALDKIKTTDEAINALVDEYKSIKTNTPADAGRKANLTKRINALSATIGRPPVRWVKASAAVPTALDTTDVDRDALVAAIDAETDPAVKAALKAALTARDADA